MVKVNFVGGPWHGRETEMHDPPPHWRVEDMRGDEYPRTTLYRLNDWRGAGGVMFWPGVLTYTAPNVKAMKAHRARIITEEEIAAIRLDGAKQRVRDQLQHDLDATMYQQAPVTPILREESWVALDFGDHKFTCRATWLYLEEKP